MPHDVSVGGTHDGAGDARMKHVSRALAVVPDEAFFM
jgi:hypothetical protein